MCVPQLGLDASGRTTALYRLKLGEHVATVRSLDGATACCWGLLCLPAHTAVVRLLLRSDTHDRVQRRDDRPQWLPSDDVGYWRLRQDPPSVAPLFRRHHRHPVFHRRRGPRPIAGRCVQPRLAAVPRQPRPRPFRHLGEQVRPSACHDRGRGARRVCTRHGRRRCGAV